MWDSVVRFEFAPPGQTVHELIDEELINAHSSLLTMQESTHEQISNIDAPLPQDQEHNHEIGSHDYRVADDSFVSLTSPSKVPDVLQHPSSSIDTEIAISSQLLKDSMRILSFIKKVKTGRNVWRKELSNEVAALDDGVSLLSSQHARVDEPLSEEKHKYITLSSQKERTDMAVLLTPVRGKLQKLRDTTPDSLPPYNHNVRTNSHTQVLKARLLPVGEFIVRELLVKVPVEERGMLELKLCRHIADEYWPLPVNKTTHIHIQNMYRNAMFKEAARLEQEAQLQEEAASREAQLLTKPKPGEGKRDSMMYVDGLQAEGGTTVKRIWRRGSPQAYYENGRLGG